MIGLSFYFSGTEAGFLSLNQQKFKSDLEQKNQGALKINTLVNRMDSVLGTALLGNNLANNSATLIGSFFCIYILGTPNIDYLSAIVTTVLLLIMGEVLPKIIFKTFSNTLLYKMGHYLHFFRIMFLPLVFVLTKITDILLFPIKMLTRNKSKFSKKDLSEIIVDSWKEGLVEDEEKHFIDTIISLSEIKVLEVMTPLNDLFIVNKKQDIVGLLGTIRRARVNILPVYEGRIDNIIGYIDLVDVFNSTRRKKIAGDFIKETKYIPETTMIDTVYAFFNQTGEKRL